MPKGKSFTAAEKHFEKKRIILQEQINSIRSEYTETYKKLVQARDEINTLKYENERLQDWVERLLEYTNLSEDDIKQVCEADKKKGESLQTFNVLMKMIGGLRY